MTEENINALRQADANLREALKMDEAERAPMPADLNERLMQRLGSAQQEKKSRRTIWPWIAAACVAGVMMVWLTPPKTETTDVVAENNPKVETPVIEKTEPKQVDEIPEEVETNEAVKPTPVRIEKPLLAQKKPVKQTPAAETLDEANTDLAVAETAEPQEKTVTLTESDIPITRPENYKYTPEEIALLKKQANEAYLKWAELELEISRYTLEQASNQ